MERAPQCDVVCLGILVADVIVQPVARLPEPGTLGFVDAIELRGGGCALNTSSALARLGLRSAALGKVGRDTFGDFVLRLLDERGVEAGGVLRDPDHPTSASVALVDPAGERTFLHVRGANAALRADELGERPFAGRALHVAGALVLDALDGEPAAGLLAEARRRGIRTSVDPVFDPDGRWERLLPMLPHCDLVTPGLAEARGITGEAHPARAAARLRGLGAGAAAVTPGAGRGRGTEGSARVRARPPRGARRRSRRVRRRRVGSAARRSSPRPRSPSPRAAAAARAARTSHRRSTARRRRDGEARAEAGSG